MHCVELARAAAWLRRRAKAGVQVDVKTYAGLYFAGGGVARRTTKLSHQPWGTLPACPSNRIAELQSTARVAGRSLSDGCSHPEISNGQAGSLPHENVVFLHRCGKWRTDI